MVVELDTLALEKEPPESGVRVSAELWKQLTGMAKEGKMLNEQRVLVQEELKKFKKGTIEFQEQVDSFEQRHGHRRSQAVGTDGLGPPRDCSTPRASEVQTVVGRTEGHPEKEQNVGVTTDDGRRLEAVPLSLYAAQRRVQLEEQQRQMEEENRAQQQLVTAQNRSIQAGEPSVRNPPARRPIRGESQEHPIHVAFPQGNNVQFIQGPILQQHGPEMGLPDVGRMAIEDRIRQTPIERRETIAVQTEPERANTATQVTPKRVEEPPRSEPAATNVRQMSPEVHRGRAETRETRDEGWTRPRHRNRSSSSENDVRCETSVKSVGTNSREGPFLPNGAMGAPTKKSK